jgi:hypothetical protein
MADVYAKRTLEHPRLVAVCDTSFGFGTPQLEQLIESLSRYYKASETWLLEPDTKGKPRLVSRPGLKYLRIATRLPPHFDVHQIDYNLQIAQFLNKHPPDLLVITTANLLPAVLRSNCRPAMIIYYMLESLDYQIKVGGEDLLILHHLARNQIDLICVPEQSRASFDLERLQWEEKPVIELFNVSSDSYHGSQTRAEMKIIHAGSLSEQTLCQYFSDPRFDTCPIDVFGICDSPTIRNMFDELLSRGSRVRYGGRLSSEELERIYGRFAYALVMWKPSDLNQILASPNKLFQSIAHGVPPIVAPHPQCVEIIRTYGCGLIMDDWSVDSLLEVIRRAQHLFNTEKYHEMVYNCQAAVEHQLNWPDQFAKLIPFLPPRLNAFIEGQTHLQMSESEPGKVIVVAPELTMEFIGRDGLLIGRRPGLNNPLVKGSWTLRAVDCEGAVSLRLTLDGVADSISENRVIKLQGFYDLERDPEGVAFRWTGPHNKSLIFLPMRLTIPAILEIDLASTGKDAGPGNYIVSLNEVPVPHEFVSAEGRRGRLIATLEPARYPSEMLTLGLFVEHTFRPDSPDTRTLGVAIKRVTLTIPIVDVEKSGPIVDEEKSGDVAGVGLRHRPPRRRGQGVRRAGRGPAQDSQG